MSEARCKREVLLPEFYRWMAMYELEPWGRESETMQLAAIGAAICRSMSGGKMKATDFLNDEPDWWTKKDGLEIDGFREVFGR